MRIYEHASQRGEFENMYVGIDVHKKSWNVHVVSEHVSLGRIHMKPPSVETLLEYLSSKYPHARLHIAYEAGFSGFWLQRKLTAYGLDCIIVHPADIPTSDKDRSTKSDAVDSRNIAEGLRAQALHGIWIPSEQEEGDRVLVLYRTNLVHALQRIKTHIKQRLLFHGLTIPEDIDSGSWTKRLRAWLRDVRLADASAQAALVSILTDYDNATHRLHEHGQLVRTLAHEPRHIERVRTLVRIRGIGLTTAMILLTEIGPIDRFRSAEALASFVGLIPAERSSSERTIMLGMQRRRHSGLRSSLIESAWVAVRHDEHLRSVYGKHISSKPAQKAIVVVARKLLNRIFYELKQEKQNQSSTPTMTDC